MKLRLIGFLFIAAQAGVLWQASGEAVFPAALAGLAAMLLLPKYTDPPPKPWLTVAMSVALAVAVAAKYVLSPPRLDPGMHAWPLLTAEFLIGLQLILLMWRTELPIYIIAVGLLTVCLLSSRDLQSRHQFSVGSALIFAAAALLYADSARPASRAGAAVRRRRLWTTELLLLVTMLGGAVLSQQMSKQLPYARRWVATRLSLPVARAQRRTVGFSGSGFLGSIVAKKKSNPLFPALRVYTDKAPGYLRGRVFVTFDGRRWQPPRRQTRVDAQTTPPADAPDAKHNLFPIGESRAPWISMQIELDRSLAGFLFLPLEARYVELSGQSVFVGANSSVLESGGTLSYRAHVGRRRRPDPQPNDPRLLQVPSGIDPRVKELAQQITANAKTSPEKIDAISSYLRHNYDYSLDGFERGLAMNPVSHFLVNRAPSHCEYFATGTVMLLRHVGVPSRYVTGFLATELEDEYGDYWLARNRDAHAWVEAYDARDQRWVIVDSTPGIDFDRDAADDATVTSSYGATTGGVSAGGQWLHQLRTLATDPLGVLGLFGIVLLARMLWVARRSRSEDQASAMRVWLDRRLRRRGLRRDASETPHQFARRIERSAADDPWLLRAARWQLQYAAVRYGGYPLSELPDPRRWRKRDRS